MSRPEVSVVVPTAGRRPLGAVLDAALRATDGVGAELIVALDGTAIATEDVGTNGESVAERVAFEVANHEARLVRAPTAGADGTGGGASGARNAGWRTARGDLILFVDDDVLLDPGAVAAHRDAHAHPHDDRDAHALGGAVRLGTGDPGERATIGRLRWPPWRRISPFEHWVERALQFGFHEIPADGRTGWWHLLSCDCALPRTALERVGGFDAERFPFGYEDLDLGLRLDRALGGLEVRLVPGAGGIHDVRMTHAEWRTRIRRIAAAERTWSAIHADAPASLRPRFDRVLADPAPRSGPLAAALAPWLSGRLPLVGPALDRRARAWWEHDLAARFDDAWRGLD